MPSTYRHLILAVFILTLFAFQATRSTAQEGFTPEEVAKLKAILSYIEIVEDEINGLKGPHLIIEGVNFHIRSGSGTTHDGTCRTLNDAIECVGDGTITGLGNIIIGYNEQEFMDEPGGDGPVRTGSHNLILGIGNSYASFSGLVSGAINKINLPFASVSGGVDNTASGLAASVSGGIGNTASGFASSVSGGQENSATCMLDGESAACSISGGFRNEASGAVSSISGGVGNVAVGIGASISGGSSNGALGFISHISGGHMNFTICGTEEPFDIESVGACTISGGRENVAAGHHSSINGGFLNRADGLRSSISGGANRMTSGEDDWRAGELFQDQ